MTRELRYSGRGYPGWWSLIEIYRVTGPVIFTGLDTIFVDSMEEIISTVYLLKENEFMMMKPFNPFNRKLASGIMGWNGDFKWMYKEFDYEKVLRDYAMEQDYVYDRLRQRGIIFKIAQECFSGIYSYKWHCRLGGLPDDARVILFHGTPRPSEIEHNLLIRHRDVISNAPSYLVLRLIIRFRIKLLYYRSQYNSWGFPIGVCHRPGSSDQFQICFYLNPPRGSVVL